jgi:hypothetical protein
MKSCICGQSQAGNTKHIFVFPALLIAKDVSHVLGNAWDNGSASSNCKVGHGNTVLPRRIFASLVWHCGIAP